MDPRREGRFTVSEKISLVRFSAVELGAGAGPGGGNRCGPGGCGKAWLDCFRKRPLQSNVDKYISSHIFFKKYCCFF